MVPFEILGTVSYSPSIVTIIIIIIIIHSLITPAHSVMVYTESVALVLGELIWREPGWRMQGVCEKLRYSEYLSNIAIFRTPLHSSPYGSCRISAKPFTVRKYYNGVAIADSREKF